MSKCNCIEEIRENLKAKIQEQERNNEGFQLESIDFDNYSIFTGRLHINAIIRTTDLKKDGTRSKPKNGHAVITFSYCPFCGERS